jgi:hypothetical protein
MHHGMRKIQDERLALLTLILKEVYRLVSVGSDQTSHITNLPFRRVVVMDGDYAAIVRAKRSPIIIKALTIRHPVETGVGACGFPFIDTGRLIADYLHFLCKGYLIGRHLPSLTVNRITSGQQCRA